MLKQATKNYGWSFEEKREKKGKAVELWRMKMRTRTPKVMYRSASQSIWSAFHDCDHLLPPNRLSFIYFFLFFCIFMTSKGVHSPDITACLIFLMFFRE